MFQATCQEQESRQDEPSADGYSKFQRQQYQPYRQAAAPSWYSHSQPATRDTREALKEDAKEAARKEAVCMKAEKELEEKLIMKYPSLYINDRIAQMKAEHYMEEAKSLWFFEGGGMAHTREVVAIANWGYQFSMILSSPIPDIPGFLQQSCFGSKNAIYWSSSG